jgi:hypothetical protein
MPHPADLPAARAALAHAQAELLAVLLSGTAPPAGFDTARLRIQADALLAKRRAVVGRLRPDLLDLLGSQFSGLFNAYAREHPRPAAGARADAAAFAATLRSTQVTPGWRPATTLPASLSSAPTRPGFRFRGAVRALAERFG